MKIKQNDPQRLSILRKQVKEMKINPPMIFKAALGLSGIPAQKFRMATRGDHLQVAFFLISYSAF